LLYRDIPTYSVSNMVYTSTAYTNNNVENCEIVANKCNIPEIHIEMDLIYSSC